MFPAYSYIAAEDFFGRLDLELDTPGSHIVLSSVTLRTTVGTARLHAPVDQDVSVVMRVRVKVKVRILRGHV